MAVTHENLFSFDTLSFKYRESTIDKLLTARNVAGLRKLGVPAVSFHENRVQMDLPVSMRTKFDDHGYFLAFWTAASMVHDKLCKMPAVPRLRLLRRFIDAEFSGSKHKPSCRRGCAFCCHIMVTVSAEEASEITDLVMTGNAKPDFKQMDFLAGFPDETSAYTGLGQKARCPFLKLDRSCGVYEKRPLACRSYLVASPPEKCDTEKYPGGEVSIISSDRIDIALLVLNFLSPHMALSRSVQQQLQGRGHVV
jgi:Fe-S-cluster containining protein